MREGAAAVANFLAKMWCLYCLSLHLEEALSLFGLQNFIEGPNLCFASSQLEHKQACENSF